MAICNGHEIRQVDIVSIINTVDGILLDCTVTSHIFSEQCLFSLYYPFTNDKYIIVDGHHHVPIAGIGSVILTIILPNSISKLTFTDTLYISTLETDLISVSIFHHKGASVHSWKKGLIILKNSDDLFSAILGGLTSILY